MELTSKQKNHLLASLAEGLKTRELNKRAATFEPPYKVSRQQVDYYRDSREVKLKEIVEASESGALRSGLALKEERVARLETLFARIEKDLLENDLVWVERERALGSGLATKFVMVRELNTAQIGIYRALLDDIAKEMNARTYALRDSSPEEENPGEFKVTVAYEEKPKQATEE